MTTIQSRLDELNKLDLVKAREALEVLQKEVEKKLSKRATNIMTFDDEYSKGTVDIRIPDSYKIEVIHYLVQMNMDRWRYDLFDPNDETLDTFEIYDPTETSEEVLAVISQLHMDRQQAIDTGDTTAFRQKYSRYEETPSVVGDVPNVHFYHRYNEPSRLAFYAKLVGIADDNLRAAAYYYLGTGLHYYNEWEGDLSTKCRRALHFSVKDISYAGSSGGYIVCTSFTEKDMDTLDTYNAFMWAYEKATQFVELAYCIAFQFLYYAVYMDEYESLTDVEEAIRDNRFVISGNSLLEELRDIRYAITNYPDMEVQGAMDYLERRVLTFMSKCLISE